MTIRPSRGLPWFPSLALITLLSQALVSGARTLISYRVLTLGGDALAIGLVAGAFALLPLLGALPVGRAVDRGHGVQMLRLGLAVATVAIAAAALSTSIAILALASAALGFGTMLHTVACQGLIPLWSPGGRLDSRFSQLTLAVSGGQFIGFLLAGRLATLADNSSETSALLYMGALAALVVPLGFVFVPARHFRLSRAQHSTVQQSTREILSTKGMKPAIFSSLAVLTGMDLLTAYLPLLGEELGLTVGAVTLLLAARALASIMSRASMPLLLRWLPRRWLLVSATLLSAVPMFLIPLEQRLALLLAAMLVIGFFWGLGQPLTMSWVVLLAHSENGAAALSVRLAGNRIGQVVVPLAAGALAGVSGITAVFHTSGLILISSAATTFLATRQSRR